MGFLRVRFHECTIHRLFSLLMVCRSFFSSYLASLTYYFAGSIFVSGSNPNKDYAGPEVKYPTEYRTERFFPSYYNQRRPQPKGLLSQLSYGGPIFDVTLGSDDLFGDFKNVEDATVVVLRPGFSTHAMVRRLTLLSIYLGLTLNLLYS